VKNIILLHKKSCCLKAAPVKGCRGHKKSPARLWAAGLYKGWVSKYNPYTILKRISSIKKIFAKKFQNTKKILTAYPQKPLNP